MDKKTKRLFALLSAGIVITGLESLAAAENLPVKNYVEVGAGVNAPIGEKVQDYPVAPLFHIAYGSNNLGKTGLGFKIGLNFSRSLGEFIETNSISPSFSVNFSPFELFWPNANVKPYVFAMADLLNEFSAVNIPAPYDIHESFSSSTPGVGGGVGVTLFNVIDANASCKYMPTSENVPAVVSGELSCRFPVGEK